MIAGLVQVPASKISGRIICDLECPLFDGSYIPATPEEIACDKLKEWKRLAALRWSNKKKGVIK